MLLLGITFSLVNCSSKLIPIKGTYLKPPYEVTTDKSFDEVWDKLIDLFAQKGLPIRIIDKNSGLITSDKSILTVTTETKDGKLKDPTAFIVVAQIYEPGPNRIAPVSGLSDVTGEWNVRIKNVNGKTSININIVNIKYQVYDAYSRFYKDVLLANYQSTGVFEKLIADIIK